MPSTADELLAQLDDADPQVRVSAALTLGRISERRALPAIRRVVQETAIDSWKRIGLLEGIERLEGRESALQLAEQMLFDPRYTNEDRQAVIQYVTRLKDPATADLIIRVFKVQERGVSYHAEQGLLDMKHPYLVEALLAQLNDSGAQKRAHAAALLGKLGDERAIEPIKALLKDDRVAWEGDYPNEPSYTVSHTAREALKALQKTSPETKPWWKFW